MAHTFFADNFNRANNTNLGTDWVKYEGSAGFSHIITSNRVMGQNSTTGWKGDVYIHSTETDSNNQFGMLRLNINGNTKSGIGLVFRYGGTGDYIYIRLYNTTFRISKMISGSETIIAENTSCPGPLGTAYITAELNGSSITATISQPSYSFSATISGTDSTHIGNKKFGFTSYAYNAWQDNYIDNFVGGDFLPATISDDFDRANAGSLGTTHWDQTVGDANCTHQILSNRVKGTKTSGDSVTFVSEHAIHKTALTSANVFVRAKINIQSQLSTVGGLVCRWTNNTNFYRIITGASAAGASSLTLQRIVSGVATNVAQNASIPNRTETWIFMAVESNKWTILYSQADESGSLTVTDAYNTSNREVGLMSYSKILAYDLSIDDWEAGDFPSKASAIYIELLLKSGVIN